MEDPSEPTKGRPGSEKDTNPAARHNANLPLWLPDDCQESEHLVTIPLAKVNKKTTKSYTLF
jgi:hypothetical protein